MTLLILNTVSWEEFYFYLTKHGYTHQHISQYWLYLDTNQSKTITFDEFWKGYKAMAEAQQKQLQNKNIDEKEQEAIADNKKKLSRVIKPNNLFMDTSVDRLNDIKGKLKKSSHKMNKREFQPKVGKVVEDEDGALSFESTQMFASPEKSNIDELVEDNGVSPNSGSNVNEDDKKDENQWKINKRPKDDDSDQE